MADPRKDTTDQTTQFKFYVGYASQDRAGLDITLHVTVPELNPALQGKLEANTVTVTNTLSDSKGNQIQSQIDTSNSIEATWFGESNRKYPPDVKKGEQVGIFKFNNSDAYYWASPGRDMSLRTRETYRLEVANKADANSPLTDINTYYFELDTINKRVRIRTSNSDNENHIYMLTIDTKNSTVCLTDEINNEILIESETPRVRLRNSEGSFLDLFGKNIIVAAPGDIIMKADGNIYQTGSNITDQASGQSTTKAGSVNISGNTTIDGKPFLPHTHPDAQGGTTGGVS